MSYISKYTTLSGVRTLGGIQKPKPSRKFCGARVTTHAPRGSRKKEKRIDEGLDVLADHLASAWSSK